MLLIIDNYDSFVFNVARYCEELGHEARVLRNDAVTLDDIRRLRPSSIIISPGPCTPLRAGISVPVIRAMSGQVPLLGICLGHQCIGTVFGGAVARAAVPMHGRASAIAHQRSGLFEALPAPLQVGRYHSLIVEPNSAMLHSLTVDAVSEEGEIMALSHKSQPTYGVQFHPESILTVAGHALLRNFFTLAKRWSDANMVQR